MSLNLSVAYASDAPPVPIGLHFLRALRSMALRDLTKLVRQRGRLLSALVRPALWLIVFGAGFQNVLGVSIIPPYQTYITYQEYMIPGLLGVVLLFNGMLSSLSLVYDREMGMIRAILIAPLPRGLLLLIKLLAGAFVSTVQAYAFLAVAFCFGAAVPWSGWLYLLPVVSVCACVLGAIGLLLSVYVRQLENFAGTMNFVIFPLFFVSSALYPLWKLRESGADYLYWLALANPFTHVVEAIRFAAYGRAAWRDMAIAVCCGVVAFALAQRGYRLRRPASPARD